jgi:hypothetical protein
MDPHALLHPSASGIPAPFWFVEFFKVLGFTLHMGPMHLWFAGIITAMLLHQLGGEPARRWSRRLMRQMPIIVALGINFGVVPLLFIQLAYYTFFYTATILMAWFWLAVIGLLIPAYYGVYYYAWGWKDDEPVAPRRQAVGWLSAGLFIAISFLYANAMSLMTNLDGWFDVWRGHSVAGAALGTGLNLADPTLWPRWLLMFGLALGTTAAWMVVDAAWFANRESDEYHAWVRQFAPALAAVGVVWAAAAGSWYVFGTWPGELRETMFGGWLMPLTLATGAAGGLPLVLMLTLGRTQPGRMTATVIGLAQFGVLGINAISRQVVQNLEIGRYFDVAAQPTSVQWGPLAMFLGVFVVGVIVILWMLAQVIKASASSVR